MINLRFSPFLFGIEQAQNCWPKTDISETEENFIFSLDLPGALKEDIKIWIDKDILTITGEKKTDTEQKFEPLVSERAFGKFERTFKLNNAIDRNRVAAELVNGVLVIKLPKVKEAKEISIN